MSGPTFDDTFRDQLAELFRWRRDVRHFKRDPIPTGTLERLVSEAALAPSVGYAQPWRFINVCTQERRDEVIASFRRANEQALQGYSGEDAALYAQLKLSGLNDAPVHLAVFCDAKTEVGKGLGRATMPETLNYSVTMAIYTFWLAARAEGIGAGWVSILEPEVVTRALDVPSDWQLVAYLCVGYPTENFDTPELARAGWETREPEASRLHQR
jgi:5,6-dimethylbenzimidazole synthase